MTVVFRARYRPESNRYVSTLSGVMVSEIDLIIPNNPVVPELWMLTVVNALLAVAPRARTASE